MVRMYVVLSSLLDDTRARIEATGSRRKDRGAVSLEQVIVSLGLFLLAVAVVAGISTAVRGRLGRIN